MMNFEVRVVEQTTSGVSAAARQQDQRQALQAINQPPTAVSTHPFDTRRGEQAGAGSQASK
jgi:cytochrome c oxidase subunit 2